MIEREVVGGGAQSHVLPGFWLVTEQVGLGSALRLAHDAHGQRPYLTPAEHEAEARRAEAEAAAQRIRELEALLDSRR